MDLSVGDAKSGTLHRSADAMESSGSSTGPTLPLQLRLQCSRLCSQCAHYATRPPARPCDSGLVIRATICDDPRISCQAEYQKPGPDTGRTCGAVNSTGVVPVHRFGYVSVSKHDRERESFEPIVEKNHFTDWSRVPWSVWHADWSFLPTVGYQLSANIWQHVANVLTQHCHSTDSTFVLFQWFIPSTFFNSLLLRVSEVILNELQATRSGSCLVVVSTLQPEGQIGGF